MALPFPAIVAVQVRLPGAVVTVPIGEPSAAAEKFAPSVSVTVKVVGTATRASRSVMSFALLIGPEAFW